MSILKSLMFSIRTLLGNYPTLFFFHLWSKEKEQRLIHQERN